MTRDGEFIRKSLAYLGVALERIVTLPKDEPVAVERLIFASSIENHALYMHRRVGDVFRAIKQSVLQGNTAQPARKVFVSRGNSTRRRLVNRTAVEERFAGLGFEVVDPGTLSYEAQVRVFAEAELVVGEHGGGLGNIGFCEPETLIIELFHPRHNDLCYLGLAETQGLLHQIFVGTDTNRAARAEEAEWAVDVEAVVDFVQRMASEREWYRSTRRN